MLESGQKVEFNHAARMSVQRPNKLRAERSGDLVSQVFVYDGKALTLYNPQDQAYAQVTAPGTLEGGLEFARTKLDILAPAGYLVGKNAYEVLMGGVTDGFVVGGMHRSGVDPDVNHVAPTRRAAPPRLQGGSAVRGDVSLTADAGRGSGSEVRPRLASPALGWRLRNQPQVGEDLLDHWPLENGGDDLQLAGAAVRAVLHIDIEYALEQPRPADNPSPGLPRVTPRRSDRPLPGDEFSRSAVADGSKARRRQCPLVSLSSAGAACSPNH